MIDKTNDMLEKGRRYDGTEHDLRGRPVGHFFIKGPLCVLQIIAHDGKTIDAPDVAAFLGWEHVSVSCGPKGAKLLRTPTWEEMTFVRNVFWKPDEWVIEYHPAKADYVNIHPMVLHLWRPVDGKFPIPPKELV
jgi:hypothetical protein